jgi:DNA-directed RNA polymerase specialized sigma24 family protein
MKYCEVADILGVPIGTVRGVPIGTVRSRMARARATLRDILLTEAEIATPGPAKSGARYERIAA